MWMQSVERPQCRMWMPMIMPKYFMSQLALVSMLPSTSMSLQSPPPLEPGGDIGDLDYATPCIVHHSHKNLFLSIFDWSANMTQSGRGHTDYCFVLKREPSQGLIEVHKCVRGGVESSFMHRHYGRIRWIWDTHSLSNDECRDEILCRTGISLLSVKSSLHPLARSKSSQEFFYSLLEKNWDRIRILHISQHDQYTKIGDTRWSRILSSPVKNKLESFRFLVNPHAFQSDLPRILRSYSAHGFFNNSAPMLTEFETSNTHCSKSFFPYLRTFSADFIFVTFGFDVGHFLDALRHYEPFWRG